MVFSDTHQSSGLKVPSGGSQPFAGKHVLVAEHIPRIAKYTRRILEKHFGCSVVTVGNGFDAMTKLDSASFDALICAMGLPGIAGFELAQEARNAFPDMGIIVTGEKFSRFPYVEAVRAGATDFVAINSFSPVRLAAMQRRVEGEQVFSKSLISWLFR